MTTHLLFLFCSNQAIDYEKLGMIFLLDVVARNIDRMPSRKLLGRPSRGNPGNVSEELVSDLTWLN